MRTRKITSLFLCLLMVFSLSIQAGAATPAVVTKQPLPDIADFGVPLTDDEMDEVRGTWGWIVLAASAAAVEHVIAYSLSNADHGFSGKDLAWAALQGAAIGGLTATVGAVAATAKGVSLAVKTTDVGWALWGSTTMGIIHGAIGAVKNELKRR